MKKPLLLLIFTFFSLLTSATHLRGGFISVKRVGVSRTCEITVTVYTDTHCSACVLFGGEQDILDFGDNTSTMVPETANTEYPGLHGVGIASYTVLHTYEGNGRYIISYQEPNRNGDILNMDAPDATRFYVETMFDLSDESLLSTPQFLLGPIFEAKLGSDLSLSAGAVSQQDYVLLYQFGTPHQNQFIPVQNYLLPENIHINPYTGLITWDTKFDGEYVAGEFAFNILVSLYKEINGSFQKVCTVSRDIQIILLTDVPDEVNASTNTDLDENGRMFIPTNESKTVKIFFEKFTTPSGRESSNESELALESSSPLELSVESELVLNSSAISFTSYDSSTVPNIKVGVLTITSQPEIDRENPYLITVRGKYDVFAKDVSFLFFTQDLQPKLTELVELITKTEDEQELLEVYPNPSKDLFTIPLPENHTAMISVHDQTGRLVHTAYAVGTSTLDLRNFSSGFYYCTIFSDSKPRRIKLIKD